MTIGRYEILDEIGQGAMGTVYRARDPMIERVVAIKTVSIAQLQREGADAESRFLREARSAGRLSHPNIVTIYDVSEADGLAYIAMEYLSGRTLRDIMNQGPIPLDLTLDTVTQMAEALAFAHEHGVIHRDIKPANVVVTQPRGRVKLTDFGIAHLINSNQTQTGQMLGSPRYMSPEQAMGRAVDGRSDIFSLGAVLYEMLTGRYAFDGESLPNIIYRVISEMPAPAETLRPQIPAELSALLSRMLSKDPQDRPDASELVKALHGLTVSAPPAPAAQPVAPSRSSRSPTFLKPLAALLLMAGTGLLVMKVFTDMPQQATPSPAGSVVQPALPANPASLNPEQAAQAPGMPQDSPQTLAEEAIATAPVLSDIPPPQPDAYLTGLDKKRVELRIKRTELLLKYTEQHPDVVRVDRELEQLRIERRSYLQQKRQQG
ncbi:serine/threonine-protein kinase [Thiobacillus sp.]|uniref:serine/threonine-protein kinase n=1 Tax=Thiobacillus sp. TaxID=924 RepID=UPI00286D7746|nr:protein kinase [Thiobacillus sp.]